MNGKAGIVTGGAKGIGKAIADQILHSGGRVLVVDRDENASKNFQESDLGDKVIIHAADVSDEAAVADAFATCLSSLGSVDFLVNCAGINSACSRAPFEEELTSDFDNVNAVNLRGTFLTMRAAIAEMKKSGGGSIVNISSTAGIRPMQQVTSYTASKWGVVGMTLTAALETAGDGIRINAVCPGITNTPMFQETVGDAGEKVVEITPMGRIADPSEIANAIMWLLSDQASFVTGIAMPVDSGLSLIGL